MSLCRFCPARRRSSRHRREAIPATTRRWERTRSSALLSAPAPRPSVFRLCLALLADTTQLSDLRRSIETLVAATQPWVQQALFGNTTGFGNTANGSFALYRNTTGSSNTAAGFGALELNTTGSNNTAAGYGALDVNTSGSNNTAAGFEALVHSGTGSNNTANGSFALQNNTTGSISTAEGFEALYSSSTGGGNVANGYQALRFNTTGSSNTANGWCALYKNTSASNNTADGYWALNNNTTGHDNTALGYSALFNNTIGSNNIALGPSAGTNLTTGSNNIDIGALGGAGESNTIRIGRSGFQTNAYITGISGVTVAGGVSVIVDANGHLGTLNSSARYKEAIQPMDKTSEAILALKPVTFRYKEELDAAGIPQFGLVAEEVAKVDPTLVHAMKKALHRYATKR